MKLLKGISSGTTALVHPGAPPHHQTITEVLEPLRGIGADLFITAEGSVRAFTPGGEISPPSAAIRIAAAYLHARAPSSQGWDFTVDGRDVRANYAEGEYVINHGPWAVAGGAQAIADGHDCVIKLAGLTDPRPGLRIRLGERTIAVAALEESAALGEVDLRTAPDSEPEADLVGATVIMGERRVDLTDDAGAVVGTQKIGALQARGYDRAVGEVYSADALAIGCAAAARAWSGEEAANEWVVVFGGGNTRVELGEHALASAQAEIFAEITWQE